VVPAFAGPGGYEMKLLLHCDIPRLGYFGDIVEVSAGYARNCLLPQRLAVEPTEANIKKIEEERTRKTEARRLERSRLVKTSEKVNGAEITISALANDIGHLFGSVGSEAVLAALLEKGFEIQSNHILLPEHIRILGTHEVKLRFADDIVASISLNIVRPEEQAGESQPEQDESDTTDADSAEQD